jgi:myosin heavy subunit
LKPNAGKTNGFDRDYVLHQLKCCGILEAIKIRRQGFSHRFTYSQFYYRYEMNLFQYWSDCDLTCVDRYRLLVANSSKAPREFCEWMLQKISKVQTYQMGVSKVFLKEEQVKMLVVMMELMFV